MQQFARLTKIYVALANYTRYCVAIIIKINKLFENVSQVDKDTTDRKRPLLF